MGGDVVYPQLNALKVKVVICMSDKAAARAMPTVHGANICDKKQNAIRVPVRQTAHR
jgi:hypothetical protein